MSMIGLAVLGCLVLSTPVGAQTLSPYSEFQGLSPAELATVQAKLTYVGVTSKSMYTVLFAASGASQDVTVFRPFYRSAFQHGYASDYAPLRSFAASTAELDAMLNSVAAIPGVTDGGVDTDGSVSFALSVVKGGQTKVFESIVDATNGRSLFGSIIPALTGNSQGAGEVTEFACRMLMLPGNPPSDVTSQVSIRLRGFRKDRSSGVYGATARVTNTGAQALAAPLIFVFRPGEGITAVTRDGYTCAISPAGAAFLSLPIGAALQPGQHVDVVLKFENPDDDPIQLEFQRVFSGAGFR